MNIEHSTAKAIVVVEYVAQMVKRYVMYLMDTNEKDFKFNRYGEKHSDMFIQNFFIEEAKVKKVNHAKASTKPPKHGHESPHPLDKKIVGAG